MKNEEVDEPSLFVEDSPIHFGRRNRPATSARPAANATKKSLQPFGIEPKWKQLFDTLLQQCVVKEKAADSGFQCLKHLIATLKAHDDPNLGRICQLWIDRIGTLLCVIHLTATLHCVSVYALLLTEFRLHLGR